MRRSFLFLNLDKNKKICFNKYKNNLNVNQIIGKGRKKMTKKNTVVKRDMKFSQEELQKLGWVDTYRTYGYSKIFRKEKQELFWDTETEIVGFMYTTS